ncbi:MAG: NAD(P)H-hydrate dehydratase [Andreesenia angusta]|nr:NAD(P)H-hydrate dehydratase [Andreesenia angusta]
MVGIDIIEISRIEKLIDNQKFLNRIYTKKELEYIEKKKSRKSRAETAAGIFCAKEAVSKALGSGIGKELSWKDMEIYRDDLGKPYLKINKKIKNMHKINNDAIRISISHDDDKAISICNIEEYREKNSIHIDEKIRLKKRRKNTNKGDYGKVAIIGGSIGMSGAPCLSSFAALRMGSGLVYTFVPESIANIVQIKSLENITIPLNDEGKGYFTEKSLEGLFEKLEKMDAIAIGPGMGTNAESLIFIEKVLEIDKPIVIDADALNLISKNMNLLEKNNNLILTPHLMEFSRLLDLDIEILKKESEKEAKDFVKKYDVILVLKGSKTLVLGKNNIYRNNTGNPGMATAGSGDVLTGIILSIIGQNYKGFDGVKSAVFLHGLSGNIAAKKKGEYGLIASDIIENLPEAIKMIIEDE